MLYFNGEACLSLSGLYDVSSDNREPIQARTIRALPHGSIIPYCIHLCSSPLVSVSHFDPFTFYLNVTSGSSISLIKNLSR